MSTDSGALAGWFKRKTEHPDDAVPDSQADDDPTAAANTTLHDTDQEPVVVWEAANRMEAEVVAGRLRSEGIPAMIRGEALGDIYGLTFGSLATTNVLVPAALADKALDLLAVDATDAEWDVEGGIENDTDIENDAENDTDRG